MSVRSHLCHLDIKEKESSWHLLLRIFHHICCRGERKRAARVPFLSQDRELGPSWELNFAPLHQELAFFPALQGQNPPWSRLKKPAASLLQVDELKAKLATQEVELRQKNEDADKLIQVVGVETDKVSREKAIADEEERKVALIMLEVQQKQKDCEEDLAKAEPALTAAQAALNTLNKVGGTCACLLIPLGRSGLSSNPKAVHHPGVLRDTGA